MKLETVNRKLYLDGLRGLACIAVFFEHFFKTVYPSLFIDDIGIELTPYISLITSGKFAVSLFFVMSGYILYEVLKGLNETPGKLIFWVQFRYFRLFIPVLCIMLFYYLLMMLGIVETSQIHALTDRFGQIEQISGVAHALRLSFYSLFEIHVNPLPVLWTLHAEFIGSLYVLIVATLVIIFNLKGKKELLVLILSLMFTLDSIFSLFILGAIVNQMMALQRAQDVIRCIFVSLFGLVVFSVWNSETLDIWESYIYLGYIGAFVLILASSIPSITKMLSGEIVVWLGRYSYYIYLLHLIAIFSILPKLSGLFENEYMLIFFALITCSAVTLALSILFFNIVENQLLLSIRKILNEVYKRLESILVTNRYRQMDKVISISNMR